MFYGQCNNCNERWELGTASTCICVKDEPWEQFYPEMGKPKLAYLSPTESPENACYIPPQRAWVGLTDDEVYKIAFALEGEHWRKITDAIEAKLKEKNS